MQRDLVFYNSDGRPQLHRPQGQESWLNPTQRTLRLSCVLHALPYFHKETFNEGKRFRVKDTSNNAVPTLCYASNPLMRDLTYRSVVVCSVMSESSQPRGL